MIYLLTYMIISFAIYTICIAKRYGVLYSISSSWYKLPKNRRWEFILFTWSLGISLVLVAQRVHNDAYAYAGMLMCFVGLAGHFKSYKAVNVIHNIGSVGCILMCCILLIIDNYWGSLLGIIIGIIFLKVFKKNNFVWWFEVISFCCIIAGLFFVYGIQSY